LQEAALVRPHVFNFGFRHAQRCHVGPTGKAAMFLRSCGRAAAEATRAQLDDIFHSAHRALAASLLLHGCCPAAVRDGVAVPLHTKWCSPRPYNIAKPRPAAPVNLGHSVAALRFACFLAPCLPGPWRPSVAFVWENAICPCYVYFVLLFHRVVCFCLFDL